MALTATVATTLAASSSAAPASTRALGPTLPTERVTVLATMRQPHAARLARFVSRVSNPKSADYGHYLSPAAFRARYAPSAASVATTERVLRAAGFHVSAVPANHRYVAATGTVAAAEALFATQLHNVQLATGDAPRPTHAPVIPAALRGIVTSVQGLDTSKPMHPLADPPPAFVNAPPCSTYFGEKVASDQPSAYGTKQPYAPCGYTPEQLEGAYGVAGPRARASTAAAQTVAIIDAYDSPTINADANKYSHNHGLPAANVTRIASPIATNMPEVPDTPLDPQGWSGEETLDVEAVHSMAPGATIVYEGADSSFDFSLESAMNEVVDNARAQIISNSYGSAGDFDNSSDWDPIFLQAGAEGIGVYFSSGDEGDETQDPNGPGDREVDAPANDPLVTAVGGTSLGVTKSNGYGFETGWGTAESTLTGTAWDPAPPGTWLYGGGGGTSQTYAQPAYQKGVVPASIANYFAGKPAGVDAGDANGDVHVPGRAVPDVALRRRPQHGHADRPDAGLQRQPGRPAGRRQHYGEYRIGGTSLSSPLFAGIMALADQAAASRRTRRRSASPTRHLRAVSKELSSATSGCPTRSPRGGETRTGCDRRGAHPTDSTGAPGGGREGPNGPSDASGSERRQVTTRWKGSNVGLPFESNVSTKTPALCWNSPTTPISPSGGVPRRRWSDRGDVRALGDSTLEEHVVLAGVAVVDTRRQNAEPAVERAHAADDRIQHLCARVCRRDRRLHGEVLGGRVPTRRPLGDADADTDRSDGDERREDGQLRFHLTPPARVWKAANGTGLGVPAQGDAPGSPRTRRGFRARSPGR